VEYFCGPIGRAFGQTDRVSKLYRTLDQYRDGWEITMVGHSNGCDVILDALWGGAQWAQREAALHLVCGACESNFHRNGLNTLLSSEMIGRVSVYVAKKDVALRLARSWAGKLLGYGTLGLHGPKYVSPGVAEKVETIEWPSYGHSDCWEDGEFSETMGNFLQR